MLCEGEESYATDAHEEAKNFYAADSARGANHIRETGRQMQVSPRNRWRDGGDHGRCDVEEHGSDSTKQPHWIDDSELFSQETTAHNGGDEL